MSLQSSVVFNVQLDDEDDLDDIDFESYEIGEKDDEDEDEEWLRQFFDLEIERVVLFRLIFIKHLNMSLLPYLDCYLSGIKHVWDFYFINFVSLDEFGELDINLDDWVL